MALVMEACNHGGGWRRRMEPTPWGKEEAATGKEAVDGAGAVGEGGGGHHGGQSRRAEEGGGGVEAVHREGRS